MKGYVTRKGDRWYAVIYEGTDPVTGRERRSWHAAGTQRADADRLALRLAAERNGRNDETPVALLRRLPDPPLAARQAGRARGQHLRRIPPQRGTPHRSRTGAHRAAAPPVAPPRGVLRHVAAPRRRQHGTRAEDRVRDPSRHPRRAERRGATGPRDPQRRARRPRHVCDPSRRSSSGRGPPRSSRRSCERRPGTGCSRRCGLRRSLGCAATSCSACAETTWTPPRRRCRSTAGWSPLATTSARRAARPPTHVGASTSTRRQSPSSAPGGHGRPRSSAPSASNHQGGCSPTGTVRRSIRTPSRRPPSASPDALA